MSERFQAPHSAGMVPGPNTKKKTFQLGALALGCLLFHSGVQAQGAQEPASVAASAAPPPLAVEAPASSPLPRPAPAAIKPIAPTTGLPHAATPLLPPPNWVGLNAAQKTALAPLEKDWDKLDEFRKGKWLEVAARYPSLPAAEQTRLQERMHDWARLSPVERQRARVGFQVAQQVKPDERQAKWEAYQALSPEERQALAEKARKKQARKAAELPAPTLDINGVQTKSNRVPTAAKVALGKSVAPSVVQAKSGASTVLITQTRNLPPAHQQAGQTKVFADPSLVDSKTLLPKKPQTPPASQP